MKLYPEDYDLGEPLEIKWTLIVLTLAVVAIWGVLIEQAYQSWL